MAKLLPIVSDPSKIADIDDSLLEDLFGSDFEKEFGI